MKHNRAIDNRKIIIGLIIFEIIVLITCFLVYKLTENNMTDDIEPVKQVRTAEEPIINLSSYPKVDATINMQNLATAFVNNFTGSNLSNDELDYSNGQSAYYRLADGTVDIVIAKEPSEDEIEYAEKKGVTIEYVPIVVDPFVFYTNSENSVDSIGLDEIQKIYSGIITNWNEIGGDDEEIRAFQRNKNSENQNGMEELVMKDAEMAKPVIEERNSPENVPIDIVSDYDNSMNSLGYSFYSYATTMYNLSSNGVLDGIKLLKIDNISPSYENVQNGIYTLKETYYLATRKNAEDSGSIKLVKDAMLSNRGKMVAKEAGYVGTKP